MRKSTLLAGMLAGVSLFAVPLRAQEVATPSIALTPYAGYMNFGNIVSGPLGTSLTNGGGAVYGAQLTVPLTRNVGVYGNVAYSKPGLKVGVPFLGGLNVGESSVWMYDGGLQLSAPVKAGSGREIVPFVQAGVGGMRYSFAISPISTRATNLAYNVGAGADIPLTRNLGLRLMAKDYIGKFDAKEITGLNLDTKTTHNWALSAGVSLEF